MTNTIPLILALAACSTTSLPEKVYDFAGGPVTGQVSLPIAARGPKGQLRAAIDQLQPAFARCTAGTSGTIDLTLHIVTDTDAPAVLDSAQLTYPDAAAAQCVRDAVARIDLSHLTAHESTMWIVHFPLVVGARS